MEEIIKLKLDRIFPRVLITIKQELGVIKIYFKLGDYFMHESIISIVNKSPTIIIQQAANDFVEHLNKFVINEKAYTDILED